MMLGELPELVGGGTNDLDGEEPLCPAPTSATSLADGVTLTEDPRARPTPGCQRGHNDDRHDQDKYAPMATQREG
eukprot:10602736-Lingulodinium_polyedra.AAC.1